MVVKVALCLPWYAGPDRDCAAHFLVFSHYLGRLQERLEWLFKSQTTILESKLSNLDPVNTTGFSEITNVPRGTTFEFAICDETGCSLPGLARERCVDAALAWNADVLLFFDSDMMFGTDAFLRLWLDDKPVVGALAFTARQPITPVIYDAKPRQDNGRVIWDYEYQTNYRRDELYQVDAIGGGVMMIKAEVFRILGKPWFSSYGMGEDVFFCHRCRESGIPVWVNTRIKTLHKPTFATRWHDEKFYEETIASNNTILLGLGTIEPRT